VAAVAGGVAVATSDAETATREVITIPALRRMVITDAPFIVDAADPTTSSNERA
jgi:hypothetical protein